MRLDKRHAMIEILIFCDLAENPVACTLRAACISVLFRVPKRYHQCVFRKPTLINKHQHATTMAEPTFGDAIRTWVLAGIVAHLIIDCGSVGRVPLAHLSRSPPRMVVQ